MKFTKEDTLRLVNIFIIGIAIGLLSDHFGFGTAVGMGLLVWVLLPNYPEKK